MNQLYRAIHMPLPRLLKKLTGYKEIYTIAIRPRPKEPGEEPLPALGAPAYTALPYTEGVWYADPLLYHRDGQRWVFCEAFDMAAQRGAVAVFSLDEQNRPGAPQVVLQEAYHLSFPLVFDWNGETWMLPETGANRSLNLYRCKSFPGEWECVRSFATGRELCDTIILGADADALALLCSEPKPDNGLYTRYRRYTLCRDKEQEGGFALEEDEPYNLQHRSYTLGSRNAGPLFVHGGQVIHPTQVSTTVDYGVYLQFYAQRGASEVPLCAATPQNVTINGLEGADIIGIHSYCGDEDVEIIDARYLKKVAPPAPAPEQEKPQPPKEDTPSC